MEEKEKKTKKTAAAKEPAEKKTATKKPAEKKAPAKKPAAKAKVKEEIKPVEIEEVDDELIELVSEDGETRKFYHVATIDYENEWYVFFQPAEKIDGADDDEVLVFKLDNDENDNDVFLPVQSEDLLQKVYAEYVRLVEEHEEGETGGCGGSCAGCTGCGSAK